jgi:ribosomal protein S18 acetylase RimI-like enzyme
MDDAAILAAQRAGQRRFYETMIGAPDTWIERGDGFMALVTPQVIHASFFNAVLYDDAAALVAALPRLDAMYTGAGVKAWTVWVHHDDPGTARACERAGHVLDATPAVMGADLADLDLEPRHDHPLDLDPDWLTLGSLNGIAYGGHPGMGSVVADMRTDNHVRAVALVDGEPKACAVGHLHEGSCYVAFVATDPQLRRRGLAAHCTAAVLRGAREAGATTTTLDSSKLGQPVYERMGYRSVGRLAMWERRRP